MCAEGSCNTALTNCCTHHADIVHGPLQVPDANFNAFAKYIDPPNPQRQIYHSMVNYIDSAIGRVVEDLKQSDLYDNTVICFNADVRACIHFTQPLLLSIWLGHQFRALFCSPGCPQNGGPLPTGNNYPLKGGKFSNVSMLSTTATRSNILCPHSNWKSGLLAPLQ